MAPALYNSFLLQIERLAPPPLHVGNPGSATGWYQLLFLWSGVAVI